MNKTQLACIFYCIILFSCKLYAQENFLPMPTELKLGLGKLDLSRGITMQSAGSIDHNNSTLLHTILKEWGVELLPPKSTKKSILLAVTISEQEIELGKEGYRLEINPSGIHISANTQSGIFYALQTLRQVEPIKSQIPALKIKDQPAFSWRGFLIDVGRNYQPLAMIKEQIDIMAKYKLNVLHFHFTEDLAWRLASKKYPGLTDKSIMRRWEGKYYTETEFRELIQYCQDRHITLVPEIDMPGHSAAFERYFGHNMQSDSGMFYIKELLKEFKETYPMLDMLHIGGDEVKIVNKNFMPEITAYVEQLGYNKTIGWTPGSNLNPQTLRQMWMGGPQLVEEKGDLVFIESKHLYINHMDPLETVTTLFHRKVGEVNKEHKNFIGATLCSWPDRAVSEPRNMFYQSAIYPGLLTFAERSWRGGGRDGWISNILPANDPAYKEFVEFENRLLQHKSRYFKDLPFPYTRQIGLTWELIGPFDNEGNTEKIFPIEKKPFDEGIKIDQVVEGGTVILKHWFGNIIQTALKDAKENTTWYARSKIWSNQETEQDFWIGFNDLSRSYPTDSPSLGTWDNKGSKAYVNGKEIAPPHWQQAGQTGNIEIPLIDEGYAYRKPTRIKLKKGWNEVLLKLPVATFKGRNWENPTKWMFTFIPLHNESKNK